MISDTTCWPIGRSISVSARSWNQASDSATVMLWQSAIERFRNVTARVAAESRVPSQSGQVLIRMYCSSFLRWEGQRDRRLTDSSTSTVPR